jgi:hypothetical protein
MTVFEQGEAHRAAGRLVDAADCFVAGLRHAPTFGPGYVVLADTLRQLGLPARTMAEQGAALLPGSADAAVCLGSALHDEAEYEAAAEAYRRALALAPDHPGALHNLGNTLRVLGRLEEAMSLLDRAVALLPEEPEFRFSRAAALLAAGDFLPGWDDHEWRWRRAQSQTRRFGAPWNGEDIAGRTILLHAEQGLGDTLQFVRYAPLVAARGASVVLEVPAPLARLLRGVSGVRAVVARGDPLPHFDVQCPLLSLPRAFATTVETVPRATPYLHANAAAMAYWTARLPADGVRVGLVWAGGAHRDDAGATRMDRRRSLRPEDLAPLAEVAGARLISLQVPPRPSGLDMVDPMGEVADFADTAAIVACLDLVISADTSVAHLAGGLGVPVWLLSRLDGCWRWLHGRDDSPWYPTMRVYRQQRALDWLGVTTRVARDLATRVGTG